MSKNQKLKDIEKILERRGKKAIQVAAKEILNIENCDKSVQEALRFFVRTSLRSVPPSFAALLSISCEAVGGDPEKTVSVGAALTLMAGTADIHDNIIDQSITKNSKPTMLGKFGPEISLLTGDTLLFKGLMLLHAACESFSKKQKNAILNAVSSAFFEISKAEATEITLKKRLDILPQEYLKVIKMKAAVAEAHTRIGAILGGGDVKSIETLSHYGRTFGILATIRDEFIDVLESNELKNRLMNECTPLPMLYALQNSNTKKRIIQVLEKKKLNEKNLQKLTKIVLKSKETYELKNWMYRLIKNETKKLMFMTNTEKYKELETLLNMLIQNL